MEENLIINVSLTKEKNKLLLIKNINLIFLFFLIIKYFLFINLIKTLKNIKYR